MNTISIEDLKKRVEEIKNITNDQWLSELDDRKMKELEFHNQDRDLERVEEAKADQDTFERFYGNKKYYKTTK